MVPIQVAEPLYVKIGDTLKTLSASQITWLFMYPDTASKWHIEVITRLVTPFSKGIPEAYLFKGKVRVEDWQGHFLKAYLYHGGGVPRRLTHSSIFIRKTIPGPAPKAPDVKVIIETDCSETDWYACTSVGDKDTGCEYEYTTEECTTSVDESGSNDRGAGAPTGSDYGTVGGGSGTPSSTVLSTVTPDTTEMATALQDFVPTFYGSTYNQVGSASPPPLP